MRYSQYSGHCLPSVSRCSQAAGPVLENYNICLHWQKALSDFCVHLPSHWSRIIIANGMGIYRRRSVWGDLPAGIAGILRNSFRECPASLGIAGACSASSGDDFSSILAQVTLGACWAD